MKKISFFSFFVLAIIAIVFWGGCKNYKKLNDELIAQSIYYLAEQQTVRLSGLINSELRILKTLANIMGEYEGIPVEQRRDRFDYMLLSALSNEPDIVTIYTVWKPNALDGMDSRYIGRVGSSPTGQYAIAYSGERWKTVAKTYENIINIMAHIHGPNAREVSVDHPTPLTIDGRDTYVVNMMVPIVNQRTMETVGGVGFLLDINIIQSIINKTVKSREERAKEFDIARSVFQRTGTMLESFWDRDYEEIAAMEVYSSNGAIIGSVFPDRIGKMLVDADVTFYGDNIRSAYNAILERKHYNFRSFVPYLEKEAEIVMFSFFIPNSNLAWTIMIATPVDYWWKK